MSTDKRKTLEALAEEAQRLELLTHHLKINGKPLQSIALLHEVDKVNDPIRPLLENARGIQG